MYIATILVSFLLTVAAIPAFIRFYHRAHISGQQMHEDVKQHKAKAGTPTMGGVVFLITAVLVWEAFLKEWDKYAGLELDLQKKLAFTEDFKEGVIAYSEKRRPQFKGK